MAAGRLTRDVAERKAWDPPPELCPAVEATEVPVSEEAEPPVELSLPERPPFELTLLFVLPALYVRPPSRPPCPRAPRRVGTIMDEKRSAPVVPERRNVFLMTPEVITAVRVPAAAA